jgi:excisionase family DNA binding protein
MANRVILAKLEPAIPTLSKVLGVSRRSVYRLIEDDLVPVVRVGRQIKVDRTQLSAWIRAGGAGRFRRRRKPLVPIQSELAEAKEAAGS